MRFSSQFSVTLSNILLLHELLKFKVVGFKDKETLSLKYFRDKNQCIKFCAETACRHRFKCQEPYGADGHNT